MINWPSPLVGGPLSPGAYPSSPCASPMGSCDPFLTSLIPAPGSPVPCEVFLNDLTSKAAQSIREREDLALIATQRDCEYATGTMKLGSNLRESELLKRQLEDSTKELMMAKARSESIVRDLLQAQQQLELERCAERTLEEEYENRLAMTLHQLEEEDRRLRRTQLFGLHHKANEVMTRHREIEHQRQEIQLHKAALEKQLRSCEDLHMKQHMQLDLYTSELQRTRLETERRRMDLETMDIHSNAMYAARVQASLTKTTENILSKSNCILQKDPSSVGAFPSYPHSPPILEDAMIQLSQIPSFPIPRCTPPVSPLSKDVMIRPPIPPRPAPVPQMSNVHGQASHFHSQSSLLPLSTPSPTPSSLSSVTSSKFLPFPPVFGVQDGDQPTMKPGVSIHVQHPVHPTPSPAQQAIHNAAKMLSRSSMVP